MKKVLITVLAFFITSLGFAQTHWTYNYNTEFNCFLTAELFIDGESMASSENAVNYEIGAFVGDECRGAFLPSVRPPFLGGGYIYNMMLYSNNSSGDVMTFRVYNHATEEEMNLLICNTTITFVANSVNGSAMDPWGVYFVTDPTPYYNVTVDANPASGGEVTGGGLYREGSECTITAIANTGYSFTNWTKNGNVISTNPTYTFEVNEESAYVANFTINTYDITVSAEPSAYGSATGSGTFAFGSTVTLTATPNIGYIFFNWTKDGDVVSTEAEYSFTAIDGVEGEYVAHFATRIYTITATVNPIDGGILTGAGQIQEGQTCTLVATPNNGYSFTNWTKNGTVVSTNAEYSFTVTADATYVANFQKKTYAITATANPATYGAVSGGGTFYYGNTCTLTATANSGYSFINWTKNGVEVSTDALYTFTVVDGLEGAYVANFSTKVFVVSATSDPEGAATIMGTGTFSIGETCTLSVEPNTYYTFQHWTKGNSVVSTSPTYSFVISDDTEGDYVAHFSYNPPVVPTQTHWTYNIYTEYNATLSGVFSLDDVPMYNDQFIQYYEIGAFVGNECKGAYLPTERPSFLGGGYIYNMLIYSNVQSGETITFRLYNHLTQEEMEVCCNTTITFVANATYGDGLNPMVIEFVTDQTPRYDISASVSPANAGVVTGAGRYKEGTDCTLTATANTGYTFANWSKNGTVVSTNSTYTFEVNETATYVANFTINTYDIAVSSEPSEYGSATGAGTYEFGSTVTLTATPNIGYIFFNWTKNGNVVSTEAEYSFTATEGVDGEYVAHFATKIYTITATVNPAIGGAVTGAGQIQEGQTCTLVAIPNNAYNFISWTKDGVVVSTNAEYSFTVMEDAAYVANFAIKTFAIIATAIPSTYGTVNGGGSYVYGTTCTLTATPIGDYLFANWSKDGEVLSTEPTYSFTVVDGVEGEYIARFTTSLMEVTATANPSEGGTVTGGGYFSEGQSCTLTATPNIGYKFASWTKNGEEVSSDAVYTFNVTESGEYVANFNKINLHWTFNINTEYNLTASMIFLIDGVSMNEIENAQYYELGAFVGDECRGSYLPAERPIFMGGGYVYNAMVYSNIMSGEIVSFRLYNHFTGEEVDLKCTTTMLFVANETYGNALFPYEVDFVQWSYYDITVVANPTEGGTVTGEGSYREETNCTLTATPGDDYMFVNWTLEDEEVSTDNVYTFTVDNDANFVANFMFKSFDITATADPMAGGVVDGAGTYIYGTTCNLVATPNIGYHFVNWTLDDIEVSTNPSYSFTVNGAADYVAHFALNSYEITTVANPVEGGTLTGAGTYTHFSTCTLTATPSLIYNFVNWTLDGVEVSTDNTISFEVTGAADYVANFELKTYEITASVNPADYGTVTGSGTYIYGNTCTLSATAGDCYAFVNWTENGVEVSSDAEYSFIVSGARNLVANFEIDYHWDINPHDFEYNMTVTGVVFIDNVEQRSDKLEIAAFCDNEIRGRGLFTYVPIFDRYMVFLMVYSNGNETIDSFLLYDHATKEQLNVHCYQNLQFVPDASIGIDNPYVFNFGHVQNNTFIPGHNWYSTYIEMNGIDGMSMLQNGLGDGCIKIMSQSSFTQYYGEYGWYGSLYTITNEMMYRVVMAPGETANINMIGLVADPDDHPITITKGMNHIGYISEVEMTIEDALVNYTSTYNDVLKSQDGFTTYYGEYGWYGSISTMEPGRGYAYKSQNNVATTFTYPKTANNRVVHTPKAETLWNSNPHAYPDNMTMMAVCELDGEELASDNYEIAAFADSECRGSVRLMYVEPIDKYVAFLTISGDEDTDLTLRLYNHKTGEEFFSNTRVMYHTDDIIGSAGTPFVIDFNNNSESFVSVYPNPVTRGERMNIITSSNSRMRIEIINSVGAVISSQETSSSHVIIDTPDMAGIYTIRIIAEDGNAKCQKFIVK